MFNYIILKSFGCQDIYNNIKSCEKIISQEFKKKWNKDKELINKLLKIEDEQIDNYYQIKNEHEKYITETEIKLDRNFLNQQISLNVNEEIDYLKLNEQNQILEQLITNITVQRDIYHYEFFLIRDQIDLLREEINDENREEIEEKINFKEIDKVQPKLLQEQYTKKLLELDKLQVNIKQTIKNNIYIKENNEQIKGNNKQSYKSDNHKYLIGICLGICFSLAFFILRSKLNSNKTDDIENEDINYIDKHLSN